MNKSPLHLAAATAMYDIFKKEWITELCVDNHRYYSSLHDFSKPLGYITKDTKEQIPIFVIDAKTHETTQIYVKYEDTIVASIANALQRELTDIDSIKLGDTPVGYDENNEETTFNQEGIEESARLAVEFKELD